MATKKITNNKSQITKSKEEVVKKESRWTVLAWMLLLLGGLGHMLPEQMAPLLKWSLWGISLQMAVGVVSVILALNFLLED